MYAAYFGLKESPFSIAPNPDYLYLGQRHKEALAHLLYGVQGDGGIILLTGEVGTGKTTLCRRLLEEAPEDLDTAFILNPRVTEIELLTSICQEFGIRCPKAPGLKALIDRLGKHLLAANARNRRCVLIIDEAQNLSETVLEQLRLLTNLETSARKLLQIILLGQPELLRTLGKRELRQLNQRITARYHLDALPRQDTLSYIRHRLAVAGSHAALFSPLAARRIHRLAGGIPRLINLICDRALLGAFAHGKARVDWRMAGKAAREALGTRRLGQAPWLGALGTRGQGHWSWLGALAGIAALLAAGTLFWLQGADRLLATKGAPMERITQGPLRGHDRPNDAYHDLFALWGLAFSDRQRPPCELAASQGLGCHSLDTGLETLLALDRPGVVQLPSGWFTLSRAEDGSLTLIAGGREYRLAHRDFLADWNNKAQLFWQLPTGWEAPLQAGATGPAVEQLLAMLALSAGGAEAPETGAARAEAPEASALEGAQTPETGTVGVGVSEASAAEVAQTPGAKAAFDAAAMQQLREFQTAAGLAPTGLPNPPTWIRLNSLSGAQVPRLQPTMPGS